MPVATLPKLALACALPLSAAFSLTPASLAPGVALRAPAISQRPGARPVLGLGMSEQGAESGVAEAGAPAAEGAPAAVTDEYAEAALALEGMENKYQIDLRAAARYPLPFHLNPRRPDFIQLRAAGPRAPRRPARAPARRLPRCATARAPREATLSAPGGPGRRHGAARRDRVYGPCPLRPCRAARRPARPAAARASL